MSDPFLILHKVRGEPAFDIATKVDCPNCIRMGNEVGRTEYTCEECEDYGFWWIIPTSGHRAHPWWNVPLGSVMWGFDPIFLAYNGTPWNDISELPSMPSGWPDHYPSRRDETPKINLTSIITALTEPLERRF